MKLSTIIKMAIEDGMETFSVTHYDVDLYGKKYEQTAETILDYINGYEDCEVVTAYFGTFWQSGGRHINKPLNFGRPKHCHIVFKSENEELPN